MTVPGASADGSLVARDGAVASRDGAGLSRAAASNGSPEARGALRNPGSLRARFGGVGSARSTGRVDALEFDDLLHELEAHAPRAARLVELRFFASLSVEHAAELLGVHRSTAESDWRFARAWLFQRIAGP